MAHDVAVGIAGKTEFACRRIEAANLLVILGSNEKKRTFTVGILSRLIGVGILAGVERIVRRFNDLEFFFDNVVNLLAELGLFHVLFENVFTVILRSADPFYAFLLLFFAHVGIESIIKKDGNVAAGELLFIGDRGRQTVGQIHAVRFGDFDVIERIGKRALLFVAESTHDHGISILKNNRTVRIEFGGADTLDNAHAACPRYHSVEGVVVKIFKGRKVFAAFKALAAVHQAVDKGSHLLSGNSFIGAEGGVGRTLGNADPFEQSNGFGQSLVLGTDIGKFGFCSVCAECEHGKQHDKRQTDGEKTRGFSHIGFLLQNNLYAYTK